MLLQELVAQIPGIQATGNLEVSIRGIAYDSRRVRDGYLFVAIKGEKTDGVHFTRQAVESGAVAVASETELEAECVRLRVPDARKFLAQVSRIFYQDPAAQLQLVAITGTNGKTTTSYLVDAIFRRAGIRTCLVGTLGMKIGELSFPSEHTTPEAPDLVRFLREALFARTSHGVIEVSSHALVLKRVFGIQFATAVFTNLTLEHLDFHRDMESYFQAKRLLFSPEGENRVARAVINLDDPYGRRLAAGTPIPALHYGFDAGADARVTWSQNRADGTDLRVSTPKGEISIHSHLVGRPNIYNILAATAVGLSLGLEPDAIQRGIESLVGIPGRMELINAGQPFAVIVDYAHTPDALEKLLETVRELPHRKIITVFGCGGDRDRAKRSIMGAVAARMSDFVVATNDNPRTEDPLAILAEIRQGLQMGSAPYMLIPDRREAISFALSTARRDDVVVLAGKGHEDYQIIGDQAYPFDDRVTAQELIHQLPNALGAQS